MTIATPWRDEPPVPIDSLPSRAAADVVVIGGGVAGLTAAYMLVQEGWSVVVLERVAPGAGMTGRSTAHIATAIDDGWRKLLQHDDLERARLAADAYRCGIGMIATICATEAIACDFAPVDGFLVGTADQADTLARELEAAHRVGLTDAAWTEPPYGDSSYRALRFPRQARLHPQKYVNGLTRAIRQRGGALYHAEALHIGSRAAPITVTTTTGTLTAQRAVVFAKNVFDEFEELRLPQETYCSYVIGMEVRRGAARDTVTWDLDEPYHYTRLHPRDSQMDILIAGGEDHPAEQKGDPAQAFARLESWARANFPCAGAVVANWAGALKQTADNLGFLGRAAPASDIYLLDGDGGLGFNHATIGAQIIRDQIAGKPNRWETVFDPRRPTGEQIKKAV